jgi:hypothetical protein
MRWLPFAVLDRSDVHMPSPKQLLGPHHWAVLHFQRDVAMGMQALAESGFRAGPESGAQSGLQPGVQPNVQPGVQSGQQTALDDCVAQTVALCGAQAHGEAPVKGKPAPQARCW